MESEIFRRLIAARENRLRNVLITVAATSGSVPRAAGTKMIVYGNGETFGTIGGGKFEALVIEEARAAMRGTVPILKTYPLHEGEADSFGAVCGGEVTVLIEPQGVGEALYLVGAGHCARALARVAADCGWHVGVMDDRSELLADFPAPEKISDCSPADFIRGREWQRDEALVMVSRNLEIDREALHAALERGGMGYVGMMGSERKVRRVFDELKSRGISTEKLARVFAPLGLDIGADSPAEIAVSVIAEIMQVLRGRTGTSLRGRGGARDEGRGARGEGGHRAVGAVGAAGTMTTATVIPEATRFAPPPFFVSSRASLWPSEIATKRHKETQKPERN